MPSFDVVSKTDTHEVTNAVDQANREINSRFDFKGTNARLEQSKNTVTLIAPTDFQVKQINEIFCSKLAKRNIDIRALDYKEIDTKLNEAKQEIEIRQGIATDAAKKLVKLIKDANLKVQTSIQGEQLRVNGKNRDDLQAVIAMLRASKVDLPLQFENFRD
ncbi:MAG: YajQ family cyclic di-GMP-binding protein [Gammaproteobacteria bacterium]|nr:YajQ family cyclic di-GMP-binding protein [Gammaproteobacteria bacterium]